MGFQSWSAATHSSAQETEGARGIFQSWSAAAHDSHSATPWGQVPANRQVLLSIRPDSAAPWGQVVLASSLDPDHPGEHIMEGRLGSYWISTGLYPQEIIFALESPKSLQSVSLHSTCVKGVQVESCSEDSPV